MVRGRCFPVAAALVVLCGMGPSKAQDFSGAREGLWPKTPFPGAPAGAGEVTAGSEADPAADPLRPAPAPDGVFIKYREKAAVSVEAGLAGGNAAIEERLSPSLRSLSRAYDVRRVRQVFPRWRERLSYLEGLPSKGEEALTTREKRALGARAPGARFPRTASLGRIYKLTLGLGKGQTLDEAAAAFAADPDVEYAEPDRIVSIAAAPDDPLYPLQWPLENTGQDYPSSGRFGSPPGTPDRDIDAEEAWSMIRGSGDVVVAVLDTGVDYKHPDLQGNMWINDDEIPDNGIDDDANGYVDDRFGYDFCTVGKARDADPIDDFGHGTHCAGIIAARANNGFGIAGVCRNAKIMALKFLSSSGSGLLGDAIDGIAYAADPRNGADIISNSWTGPYSATMEEAFLHAYEMGLVLVAAAGNTGMEGLGYPAAFEHVISVAATDSNDDLAVFSTRGSWIDLAAPGVDILSLRAAGTFGPNDYDQETTVYSGTSMACPHVAGACAMLLSIDPYLTPDEAEDVLRRSTDALRDPATFPQGRLNAARAIRTAIPRRGRVVLDRERYSCGSTVGVSLFDADLAGEGGAAVRVESTGGDAETVTLEETESAIGISIGSLGASDGPPVPGDGVLQTSHDAAITAIYEDADDGSGGPARGTDSARADCVKPSATAVQYDETPSGPEMVIAIDTDEATTVRIVCTRQDGTGAEVVDSSLNLSTHHAIRLSGFSPRSAYRFVVEITDAGGNVTVDGGGSPGFSFTSDAGPREMAVPAEFPAIQDAIDLAWDGATVVAADGTYSGPRNRDLDFRGKAITVRSRSGAERCVIECLGQGRGFNFHSGEGAASVLEGFTITHGRSEASGGGGLCEKSSPTIRDCIFDSNSAWAGGGLLVDAGGPSLIHCTFRGNRCDTYGGAVYNYIGSSAKFSRCTFQDCISGGIGGGMFSYYAVPGLEDCLFAGNQAASGGGGSFNWSAGATFTRTVFRENASNSGGGMLDLRCSPVLTGCVFSGNSAYDSKGGGGGMLDSGGSSPSLVNCVFSGNSALGVGGGLRNMESAFHNDPVLLNCIIWGNTAAGEGPNVYNGLSGGLVKSANPSFSHCDIEGSGGSGAGWGAAFGTDGGGNLDADPLFVDPRSEWKLSPGSPCIDAGSSETGPAEEGSVDLAGRCRFMDGDHDSAAVIDMGACEFPRVWFVREGAEAGSGASWAEAMGSLQDALAAAEPCDSVWVARGTYRPDRGGGNVPGDRAASFRLETGVGLYGGFKGQELPEAFRLEGRDLVADASTLSGDLTGNDVPVDDPGKLPGSPARAENSYHVVTAAEADATAALDGFTISGGNADGLGRDGFGGGMIVLDPSAPAIRNCTFLSNVGMTYGGGLSGQSRTALPLESCTFSGNFTTYGGGGLYVGSGAVTLDRCSFRGNRAGQGGGLHGENFTAASAYACVFEGNSAAAGGALYAGERTSLRLAGCTFSRNQASGYGGAVHCRTFAEILAFDSFFIGNSGTGGAGALFFYGTAAQVLNCTFYSNSTPQKGRALGCWSNSGFPGPSYVRVDSSILWDGGNESWNADGSVVTVVYSDVQGGYPGKGNFSTVPGFVDPARGNFHLSAVSPCINKGNLGLPLDPTSRDLYTGGAVDPDGDPRVMKGVVDVGADEVAFLPAPVKNPSPINGASLLEVRLLLRWEAGAEATTHEIYFGTDSTPDADDHRVSQTVFNNAFDPGPLAPATTYFWRVDEKNSAGVKAGPIWKFTTAPLPGKPSAPRPSMEVLNAELVKDGSFSAGAGAWSAGPGWSISGGEAVYIGCEGQAELSQVISVKAGATYRLQFRLLALETGVNILPSLGDAVGFNQYFTLPGDALSTHYLTPSATGPAKLSLLGETFNCKGYALRLDDVSLKEVKVFNRTPPAVVLGWTRGSNTTSQDVYLSTSQEAVMGGYYDAYLGDPAGDSISVGPLLTYTRYFWRVDEHGPGGTTRGDMWCFQVAGTPADHLVGWWRLDEAAGKTARDDSGKGNQGTLIDNGQVGMSWRPAGGVLGGAASFDGDGPANDTNTLCRIEVPTNGMNASGGTAAFWAKLASPPPASKGNRGGLVYLFGFDGKLSDDQFQIYLNSSDRKLTARIGGKYLYNLAILKPETWCHIAITWDGKTLSFHLDGVPVHEEAYSGFGHVPSKADIGNTGGTAKTGSFHGLIDDFRIFDRALSDREIEEIYGEGGDPAIILEDD